MNREVKLLVRDCVHGLQKLLAVAQGHEGQRDVAAAAAMLGASIAALGRVGSEVEAHFLSQLRDKLLRHSPACADGPLLGHIDDAQARMLAVPWLGEDARRRSALHIYFIRHAEATNNMEKRLHGCRLDGALTPNGRLQSRRTARYLTDTLAQRGIDNVLLASSPVGRALETAQEIRDSLCCPLHTEPDLAELDFGDWTGRYVADIEATDEYGRWAEDNRFNAPPEGESMFEVRTRICRVVSRLLSASATNESTLIVVTHFFPLIELFSELMPSESIRPGNSSVTAATLEDGCWQVTLKNYEAHLGSDATPPVSYV